MGEIVETWFSGVPIDVNLCNIGKIARCLCHVCLQIVTDNLRSVDVKNVPDPT